MRGNLPKAIEAFKQAKEFGELMEKELDSEAARTALAEALRAERRTTKVDQELVGAAADVWNSAPQQATNRGWREREDEGKFLGDECRRPLRGQVGEALQDGRRHHAQFVGGELGAIEPEGLKAERSGSRNIPKIRRDKSNRFLGKV